MSTVEEKSVAIVGAGLVGSLLALRLANLGYHVKLYERRPDIRTSTHIEGHRSINLALSQRGLSALRMVGLDEEVLKTVVPMQGRMIHPRSGGPCKAQPYGTYGECINSVDRRLLNKVLLDRAEALPNVQIHFEWTLESMDPDKGELVLSQGGAKRTIQADYIFGCDGAYSACRLELMKREPIDFEQHYITHGYKELCIMPDAKGKPRLPATHLHIWPRELFMLIALPNQDGSFTVTLFYPFQELKSMQRGEEVLSFFEAEFPDALELIGKESLLRDFFASPASPLMTLKMNKYNYKDKVLLLGDAIHAMVPFYGQGMNAGFEDCQVLSNLLEASSHDLGKAISAFTQARLPDAHAICDLALYNYTEMSTLVLSKKYLTKKWLYNWLHWMAPQTFVPLYTIVSFTQIPYSEAVKRRDKQDKMVALAGTSLLASGLALVAFKLLQYHRQ